MKLSGGYHQQQVLKAVIILRLEDNKIILKQPLATNKILFSGRRLTTPMYST